MSISQCHRDLGILVCSTLSWANHYSMLCSSAYSSLYMIRRNASSAALSVRKTLYLSLVRCHLSYCSQLWRPCLIKDIGLLERVQRRATKFITENYEVSYKNRLLSLGLLPLMYWFELLDIMFLVHTLKNPPDNFDIYDHLPSLILMRGQHDLQLFTTYRASIAVLLMVDTFTSIAL